MTGALPLVCLAVCTGVGIAAQKRCRAREVYLSQWVQALRSIHLTLEEESEPLPALLARAAQVLPSSGGFVGEHLRQTAALLQQQPALTAEQAYQQARRAVPAPCEQPAERALIEGAMRLLGQGTAAMRMQAADSCAAQLSLLWDGARDRAERCGRLYGRLGVLAGVALGIALW